MRKSFPLIIFLLFVFQFVSAQKRDTIVTKSGLKYVRLRAGSGSKPAIGQKVKVEFTGSLPNGTVFNSTDGVPFKFEIGDPQVIPGWNEGFQLMSAGEKGVLIIPAPLGFGKEGYKDDDGKYLVPPNSVIIFEVELLSIK
jgi:FKBP-type peptidyl-prolyl cis-trans isomerase